MFQPFTLIQGPPGTGKTVTVVRLTALYVHLNGMLDSRYHKNNIKPQVMICGPSNKSVDVIAGGCLYINSSSVWSENASQHFNDDKNTEFADYILCHWWHHIYLFPELSQFTKAIQFHQFFFKNRVLAFSRVKIYTIQLELYTFTNELQYC